MSAPQRHADAPDDVPALVAAGPDGKPQPSRPLDDYDPEAAIAMLRRFSNEPSEDPEAEWAEFPAFARAIGEDR